MQNTTQNIPPQTKKVLWAVGAIASLYTIAVISSFIIHLRKLPISTNDPAAWGQLGDYLGGMLNPMFALINILAVFYIAVSVQKHNEEQKKHHDAQQKEEQNSEERIKTVVELHREWNSESIYQARTRSAKTVRDHVSSNILKIEEKIQPDEAAQIWIVVGFFMRLSFLVQHDRVHKEMVTELFGEPFLWWWVVSFERQLIPCDWDARDRISSLKTWLYENTPENRRNSWESRAKTDLAKAITNEGRSTTTRFNFSPTPHSNQPSQS